MQPMKPKDWRKAVLSSSLFIIFRGGFRAPVTYMMEFFVTIVIISSR